MQNQEAQHHAGFFVSQYPKMAFALYISPKTCIVKRYFLYTFSHDHSATRSTTCQSLRNCANT